MRAKLAGALVVCALAAGGVIAGLTLTRDGVEASAPRPTTGEWAPITVTRPEVPIIGGGIPVDIDPTIERRDFGTTLELLPGRYRYRLTVSNTSNLGTIDAFQWYPPTGVQIVKLIGSSLGRCDLEGLTGFGGKQFPTVVLAPNVRCDRLGLKPPSCLCLGDGGAVTISFATDKAIGGPELDIKLRAATLVVDPVPLSLPPAPATPGP